MARLPIPGSDDGSWGDILNAYLLQSLTADGSIRTGVVGSPQLADGAVSTPKLADTAVTSAKLAPSAVTSSHLSTGSVTNSAITDGAIAQSKIANLSGDLAGKANTTHTHSIADTTNLQTTLDSKADSVHTHTASQLSDATTAGRTLITAADAAAQRTALGLGSAATLTVGTTTGTVAAGDDSRLTGAVQASGLDAATAGLVGNSASATMSSLSSTFARKVTAFDGLKASLDAGLPTAIGLIGDSTGDLTDEWMHLLAEALGDRYASTRIEWRLWDDATQDFQAVEVIQAGAGAHHALGANSRSRYLPAAAIPHIGGDLSVRVKVAMDDWSPASNQTLIGRYGASGGTARSWYLAISAAGVPFFVWSADGSAAAATMVSGTALAYADGATKWVRADFDADNGSGGCTVTFYVSDDGVSWSAHGSPVTHAATATIFNASAKEWEIGGRTTTSELVAGKIYEVDIRDANGVSQAPRLPGLWQAWDAAASMTSTNPAILTIVNGSKPGVGLSYFNATTTRVGKMTPNFGQAVHFLSTSHNEAGTFGREHLVRYAAWRDAVAARLPYVPLVLITQNPQTTPRPQYKIDAHAARRADLLALARATGDHVADTYQAFLDDTRADADLINAADGIHPTAAGCQLWADTVAAAIPR